MILEFRQDKKLSKNERKYDFSNQTEILFFPSQVQTRNGRDVQIVKMYIDRLSDCMAILKIGVVNNKPSLKP